MTKKTPFDLPHVGVITDDEIAQAICNFVARNQLGIEPGAYNLDFKVTYRNVKDSGGGTRLFASIAITGIGTQPPPTTQDDKK